MLKLFDETKQSKYYVNEKGEVFRKFQGKLFKKKPTIHKKGYVYVRTKNRNFQLHRIVAENFIYNIEKKPCVNHKDCNKQNNSVENLEWVTYKENTQHAIKMGVHKKFKKNEGRVKYSLEQCRDVVERVKSGMTYIKAGEKYNMPYSTVAHLILGSRRLL